MKLLSLTVFTVFIPVGCGSGLYCVLYRHLGEQPGSLLEVIIIMETKCSSISLWLQCCVFVLELHIPAQVCPTVRNMMLFIGHLEKSQYVCHKMVKWVHGCQSRPAICWQEWRAYKMSFFLVIFPQVFSCSLSLPFYSVPYSKSCSW